MDTKRKQISRYAAGLALFLSCVGSMQIFAQDPAPIAVTEEIELFNGKDLTNWYRFIKGRGKENDPKHVFSVINGILRVSGEEMGCITTEKAYRDYRLTVEYRWTGRSYGGKKKCAPDSGILFHSTGKDGGFGDTWMLSHEYNLILGASGDFWTVGTKERPDIFLEATVGEERLGGKYYIYSPTGKTVRLTGNDRVCRMDIARDWADAPTVRPAENEKPLGEWNTAELICEGDRVTCLFNGKVVNRARVQPSAGKIQLQSELCGIEFRRITLSPLKKKLN